MSNKLFIRLNPYQDDEVPVMHLFKTEWIPHSSQEIYTHHNKTIGSAFRVAVSKQKDQPLEFKQLEKITIVQPGDVVTFEKPVYIVNQRGKFINGKEEDFDAIQKRVRVELWTSMGDNVIRAYPMAFTGIIDEDGGLIFRGSIVAAIHGLFELTARVSILREEDIQENKDVNEEEGYTYINRFYDPFLISVRNPEFGGTIVEIDARALARTYGTISQVPEKFWDFVAGLGTSVIWLKSAWEESPLSFEMMQGYSKKNREVYPGVSPIRIAGGYDPHRYELNRDVAISDEEFESVRETLREKGIKLILDFVTNHIAADSPYITKIPGLVHVNGNGIEHAVMEKGAYPAQHLAQIDYLDRRARRFMIDVVLDKIAQLTKTGGMRADLAHLAFRLSVLDIWGADAFGPDRDKAWKKIERLMPREFWQELKQRVNARYPGMLLFTETYNPKDIETFVKWGFNPYNKVPYDLLVSGDIPSLRRYLLKENPVEMQRWSSFLAQAVHFAENHDELAAQEAFKDRQHMLAASAILWSLPGYKLIPLRQIFGMGKPQGAVLEMKSADGGIHPFRYPDVTVNPGAVVPGISELMRFAALPVMRQGEMVPAVLQKIEVDGRHVQMDQTGLVAFTRKTAGEQALILVNYSSEQTVQVTLAQPGTDQNIQVTLGPWQYSLLSFEQSGQPAIALEHHAAFAMLPGKARRFVTFAAGKGSIVRTLLAPFVVGVILRQAYKEQRALQLAGKTSGRKGYTWANFVKDHPTQEDRDYVETLRQNMDLSSMSGLSFDYSYIFHVLNNLENYFTGAGRLAMAVSLALDQRSKKRGGLKTLIKNIIRFLAFAASPYVIFNSPNLALAQESNLTSPISLGRSIDGKVIGRPLRLSKPNAFLGSYYWGTGYTGPSVGTQNPSSPLTSAANLIGQEGFQTIRVGINPQDLNDISNPIASSYGFTVTQENCGTLSFLGCAGIMPAFQELFNNPKLSRIILTASDATTMGWKGGASSNGHTPNYFNDQFLTENASQIEQEYTDMVIAIANDPGVVNKTIIIDFWEGDNLLYCDNAAGYSIDPSSCNQEILQYMQGIAPDLNTAIQAQVSALTHWLQLRKTGIQNGISLVGDLLEKNKVTIAYAVEFNTYHLLNDQQIPSVLFDIIPKVNPDYASYSSYESLNKGTLDPDLGQITALLATTSPNTKLGIGEMGFSMAGTGNDYANPFALAQSLVAAQRAGVAFAVIWESFNDPDPSDPSDNYGLINEDGTERSITATFTYNAEDKHLGGVTYGGYSDSIVVDEAFALRISDKLNLAAAAPLLCAGITTYPPLRHWKVGKGQKVGIVGLGGDWDTWA